MYINVVERVVCLEETKNPFHLYIIPVQCNVMYILLYIRYTYSEHWDLDEDRR